jgi:putative hydrolase of the HAD superfamily
MIKAILCDIDGVVIIGQSFKVSLARDHGLAVPGSFFSTVFAECQRGVADLRVELAMALPSWGWKAGVEDFLEEWFAAESVPDEELLSLLGRYRRAGLRCYVASMQEPCRADFLLRRLHLADHFDGAFLSCVIGQAKSSPGFFRSVLDQLPAVGPHQVVLIDDQRANVQAARQAGLLAIEFTTVADMKESLDTMIGPGSPEGAQCGA